MLNIRRISAAAIAAVMLLAAPASSGSVPPRLYVFYPARMNTAALQQKFTEAYPGMQVTVFGRYADFSAGVGTDAPEAVLTRPVVLGTLDGYIPAARGTNGAEDHESMVLLSLSKDMDAGSLAGKTVGMVDLLGREGMTELVKKYFPVPPRIKRVTKTEDLLPLLIFKMAEAVLVPQRLVPYIRTMSKQDLFPVPVPGAVTGIAVLGVRHNSITEPYTALLPQLPADIKEELGVTAWRRN